MNWLIVWIMTLWRPIGDRGGGARVAETPLLITLRAKGLITFGRYAAGIALPRGLDMAAKPTKIAVFLFGVVVAASPVSAAADTANQALAAQVLSASGADAASWMAKNGPPAHDKLVTLLKHVEPNVSDEAASSAADTEIQYEASAMYQENIKLYATHFNDEQLKDLLAFYRSAGGRAWIAQAPLISQERTVNTRQMSIDVVRRMVNSACKSGSACN